uniref:Inhibitor I9 domain-containing protein n=1 Tax=Oryza nivara TaxID=4536 RepID=A0A0E0GH19_ORYNI
MGFLGGLGYGVQGTYLLDVIQDILLKSYHTINQVHIVYLGHNDGLNASLTASLHLQLLSGVFTRSDEARDAILYSYSYGFSGFAAMLNSTQAAKLSEAEEVISIFRSRMLEIHTTRSWDFMGLSLHIQNEQSAGMQLKYGDDIIVGILDTGGLEAKQTVIPAARRAYIPKQTFAFCQSLLSSRLLLPSAASPTAPAPALPVQALLTTAGLLPHHPDLSLVALNSLLRHQRAYLLSSFFSNGLRSMCNVLINLSSH